MIDLLIGVGVLLVGGIVGAVVFLAREQRIPPVAVRLLAALSALALGSMLLSDWPSEVLARFWADHSVVAGILSTILLVGVVFLAFEDNERRRQEQLDASVTSAGIGGIVDHVVDAEIALALISRGAPPPEVWNTGDKPLRWLREVRDRCGRQRNGGPRPEDPRHEPATLHQHEAAVAWRTAIIDQAVRRLLAGLRDWGPVIQASRNGTLALIAIGELRNGLMDLSDQVDTGDFSAEQLLISLRQRLRLLAHFLETTSGSRSPRDEVLTVMDPLPLWPADRGWTSQTSGRGTFGRVWARRLDDTMSEVNHHA